MMVTVFYLFLKHIYTSMGKTLKDNPEYRAKELALHENELEVRRNEAKN